MNVFPPLGFHFRVVWEGIAGAGEGTIDSNFKEVTGLTVEREVQKFQEGGVNGFQHSLPKPAKYPNLVLKRGMALSGSLIEWLTKATEQFEIEPVDLNVILLDYEHKPLVNWNVKRAWPIKWETSGFNASGSEVVIESIELTYQNFTRTVEKTSQGGTEPDAFGSNSSSSNPNIPSSL
ncbi:MAG: phage tail protein [Bacteroidota bacterium]